MGNPKEVLKRNLEDLKGIKLRKLGEGIYVGRNFLKDVLINVEGAKWIFIHCVGDCIKGTGCVVYSVESKLEKGEVNVEELNLTPLFVTTRATTALHSLLEASKRLGIKRLEEAYNTVMDMVNEGKFLEWED
ncbi:MAG: hypothetical protein OWQ54_09235 [Sulfolobaceae archaeon]|nr:hypothetical protein [Sulfolobaceae archaeon]